MRNEYNSPGTDFRVGVFRSQDLDLRIWSAFRIPHSAFLEMLCPTCGHTNLPGADTCIRCVLPLTSLDGPAPADPVEWSLMSDPVSVLKPNVPVTVRESTPLDTAIASMMSHGLGALLVLNADGALAGILTERDFLTKIAGHPGYERKPVSEFMTPNPETVGPDEPLAFAVRKMDVGGYRHLPVVEAGRPVGVVSVRDVLTHVTKLCRDG